MPLSDDPIKRARQLANLTARPPAPPEGNVRTLKHGAGARKATLVRAGSWAASIMVELAEEAPLRGLDGGLPLHDRQVVELLASALARLEAVTSWLDSRPAVREDGSLWPAEDTAGRLRREVARYLGELGMTPTSRARLGLDLVRSFDLAQVWAEEADADAITAEAVEEGAVSGPSRPADHDLDDDEGAERDG
jgi:hypothetical protein